MFEEVLKNTREKSPLVHCITNYVTTNDVANTVLAIGASPAMVDEVKEVADFTSICGALLVNVGTVNERVAESIRLAMETANEKGKKIVLDPVGCGAGHYRTELVKSLLQNYHIDVMRGNASEIKALFEGSSTTKGVDVNEEDTVNEENLQNKIAYVKEAARYFHTVVAMTGKIDLVSDGNRCFVIYNGCPIMKSITGAGCMLSGLTAAMVGSNENALEATATAVITMGVAGEIAGKKLADDEGNASFRTKLIDAIYLMNARTLEEKAEYEIH